MEIGLLLLLLLSTIIISVAYYFGRLIFAIRWGIHDRHYFLGYSPRLFDLKVFGTKVSIGLYLPIAGLFRIYRVEEGQKLLVSRSWQFFEHSLWKRFVVTIGSILSLTLASILIFIGLT